MSFLLSEGEWENKVDGEGGGAEICEILEGEVIEVAFSEEGGEGEFTLTVGKIEGASGILK